MSEADCDVLHREVSPAVLLVLSSDGKPDFLRVMVCVTIQVLGLLQQLLTM
jgi:hypothetical protein